uniref:Sushi domain-containing protein n=1 Tax=Macrostomum lignano TaxID=282301 RepID=A0A1I8IG94_9PLAT
CQNATASAISGYNPGTMTATNVTNNKAYYNLFNIGLESSLRCLPGFFRERDSPTATVATPTLSSSGQSVNTMLCGYNMSGSAYSPVVLQGFVEQCYPIRCATAQLKADIRIPNVEPYDSQITASHFNYSQRFYVTCNRGYVSYKNTSSITSPVECGQNYMDPTMGEWVPFDLNTCQATTSTRSRPWRTKADNRINQKQYSEFQSSSYPYYPNRVYIKCSTPGYFFDDRQFEKTIGCDLLNGSLIEGAWTGVLGTKLSLLKSAQCIEVSCDTDILIPKTAAGLAMLESLNYKSNAVISFDNGTVVNTNASSVNNQELMPYKTVLTFFCQDGMDTGTGAPIALCRSSGDWNLSSLPTCTKVSGKLDVRGKFFVPPAVEAAAAGSVGALAITISVLFGISLLMLDLSTLSRDLALMKRNLTNLKRRLDARRLQANKP